MYIVFNGFLDKQPGVSLVPYPSDLLKSTHQRQKHLSVLMRKRKMSEQLLCICKSGPIKDVILRICPHSTYLGNNLLYSFEEQMQLAYHSFNFNYYKTYLSVTVCSAKAEQRTIGK